MTLKTDTQNIESADAETVDNPAPASVQRKLTTGDKVHYYATPPELPGTTESTTWVNSQDFLPRTKAVKRPKKTKKTGAQDSAPPPPTPYLIIGFDTEFKTPNFHVSRSDIVSGQAKYRVLSYQFHAKTSDGREWKGICCPKDNERMSLGEFLVFALGLGARNDINKLPTKIFLVGHFTRADIPAFSDFKNLTDYLSSVRNTFISAETGTPISIKHSTTPEVEPTELTVLFRDTLLLTPQASKSLKALGDLVGVPKLQLDPDPKKHKEMIQNMDRVRLENWDLFKSYALNDATICVRYIEHIISLHEQVTEEWNVPLTLTSIGVKLLQKSWKENFKQDPLHIVGKERVSEKRFDKKKGCFIKFPKVVHLEKVHWHNSFVTECYHGGRNEQFWFGPCFEDNWIDYDLSSAYPTAMSLIGMPNWDAVRDADDPDQFTPTSLGFVFVDFEFPPDTRFPTLPVRTDHGLIFPLKGRSYCSSPELHVAIQLGAKIVINRGLIVPTNPDERVFGKFIKSCLKRRKDAGSKTLEGLFWKEISNSTYGKTAQGLKAKRIYDMRDRTTRELPESPITNAFYASYITSFTRAVMGEIMNKLPATTCVFSCTTDGFLSNANDNEINIAQQGDLSTLFRESRESLTGIPSVLEMKHEIRRPLGWRTRGQATLLPGVADGENDDKTIVLAKGGIFTPPECESVEDQNAVVTTLFFNRTPKSVIHVESMTGVRDIVEHEADLVTKVISKRLSMEFDWKRCPKGVGYSETYQHLMFSTAPWKTSDQFEAIREHWDMYTKSNRACLKAPDDYTRLAFHIESHSLLSEEHRKNLNRSTPDITRLRQRLCSAWKESKIGFVYQSGGMTANGFAAALTAHGIPCKKTDVENAGKKAFVPHSCPPTRRVIDRLVSLKNEFIDLDIERVLYRDISDDAVRIDVGNDCEFILRCD